MVDSDAVGLTTYSQSTLHRFLLRHPHQDVIYFHRKDPKFLIIEDEDLLVEHVLPKFSRQTSYKSFTKQLNVCSTINALFTLRQTHSRLLQNYGFDKANTLTTRLVMAESADEGRELPAAVQVWKHSLAWLTGESSLDDVAKVRPKKSVIREVVHPPRATLASSRRCHNRTPAVRPHASGARRARRSSIRPDTLDNPVQASSPSCADIPVKTEVALSDVRQKPLPVTAIPLPFLADGYGALPAAVPLQDSSTSHHLPAIAAPTPTAASSRLTGISSTGEAHSSTAPACLSEPSYAALAEEWLSDEFFTSPDTDSGSSFAEDGAVGADVHVCAPTALNPLWSEDVLRLVEKTSSVTGEVIRGLFDV